MPITSIDLIPNPYLKKMKPIKEKQDILIPDIVNPNISRRNGMVYCLSDRLWWQWKKFLIVKYVQGQINV